MDSLQSVSANIVLFYEHSNSRKNHPGGQAHCNNGKNRCRDAEGFGAHPTGHAYPVQCVYSFSSLSPAKN